MLNIVKSKSKRKTRSQKFPLTLHKTGQYCKKIKGKLYYFGTDRKIARQKYLEKAAKLHSDRGPMGKFADNLPVKKLCNLYLDYQESRATIGEIKPRHLYDQTNLLRDFVRFIDPNRIVSDVSTIDLQSYRRKLIKAGKPPRTINNRIAAVKAMYNWATNNEIMETAPNLKAIKKISPPKDEKPTFTALHIHTLLEHADVQMKAMIWLGLNCGFGCTDCAELRWKDLDLKNGRVRFPRGKTGISRNLLLWVETIKALKAVPIC
ncbi:MAG: tyrosine-type recombinase/integrase [Planctomycetota bacterium]|jgi:integrase